MHGEDSKPGPDCLLLHWQAHRSIAPRTRDQISSHRRVQICRPRNCAHIYLTSCACHTGTRTFAVPMVIAFRGVGESMWMQSPMVCCSCWVSISGRGDAITNKRSPAMQHNFPQRT